MPVLSPNDTNLSTHPLVAKVLGDCDRPPSLVALTGYIGPCANGAAKRLYPRLDFQSYFEIPISAIVATHATDPTDELSPTVVYLKAGTPVEAVTVSTHPIECYLQGAITADHLPGATAAESRGRPAPVGGTVCSGGPCPSHHQMSRTDLAPMAPVDRLANYYVAGTECSVCPTHAPCAEA